MKKIKVSRDFSFGTVQEAVLHTMRVHESLKASPAYADYPADLLRHLWSDLQQIRAGIADRAVPDEIREAA